MAEPTFGGNWTEDKLERLAKYLAAYRTIFTANEKARYFRTWYVDAFAGTGARSQPDALAEQQLFQDVYEETEGYRDGSARIALGLSCPFDKYLFIEELKGRVNQLEKLIESDYPQLVQRCELNQGDANSLLKTWCQQHDWKKERAVVFLDPYGMQVEWSTIEVLGATKGIDLWYLFPLGVGAARLLRHDGKISTAWQNRLQLLFGTNDWRQRLYRTQIESDLFGDRETVEREPVKKIEEFIHERLATCFAKVAKGLVLRNSKSSPLYLLCFAAANERGAATAIKIAQAILKD
jgi:three-Cys-motif partner protein